ncbi:MAG: hypothetical protein JKY46_02340 [Robiginitomaculum sp.]|nr:hypothetical protein [Robiginitomaculum sp.]
MSYNDGEVMNYLIMFSYAMAWFIVGLGAFLTQSLLLAYVFVLMWGSGAFFVGKEKIGYIIIEMFEETDRILGIVVHIGAHVIGFILLMIFMIQRFIL